MRPRAPIGLAPDIVGVVGWEIEVLSMRGLSESKLPTSMLALVDRLFENMTDRQLAAIQTSLKNCYY